METPDREDLEEQFARLMAAYDEARTASGTLDLLEDRNVPAVLRPRLRSARAALQLLEAVWPRG
jgi:hypothetical protein